MSVNEYECEKAGVDVVKIKSLSNRIQKAAQEARDMGVQVFGGSNCGSLRYCDDPDKGHLILSSMDGSWSGGDGSENYDDDDGLFRGE